MQKTSIILFDDAVWENLLPLTFTRSAADLRVGITTIREKWGIFYTETGIRTQEYLMPNYKTGLTNDNLFVHAGLLPDNQIVAKINSLKPGEFLKKDNDVLAFRASEYLEELPDSSEVFDFEGEIRMIKNPWDIFMLNDLAIREDYNRITRGRKSEPISTTNRISGIENIFLEPGARVEHAIINALEGPVYVAKDAEIWEGAAIRGPLALCEHATIKMGAKIYGATTIGPHCKAAGEIQNSILTGFSNKGHDGYLGNAVLGEWCNIGADSNNSNLKNNYDKVKLWNYKQERFISTGLQFCGLIMGDHSKCGINTMFNTGTVVGVSANIFGSGFPRNFVPSFSWGGAAGFSVYQIEKALETARIVYSRRNMELSEIEIAILKEVFTRTAKYRNY